MDRKLLKEAPLIKVWQWPLEPWLGDVYVLAAFRHHLVMYVLDAAVRSEREWKEKNYVLLIFGCDCVRMDRV